MIRNQWYVVLESKEVKPGRPLGVMRMGEQLAFWRDAQGTLWVGTAGGLNRFDSRPWLKLLIPGAQRDNFLRNLNLMNINHLTLFPDLFGAAHYSNLALDVDGYLPIGEQHWRKPGS